ncbi:MAG: ABC transporter six-transmembrane domain-containing protein [Ignavibacteriales bacterium]|nr:ABC transporter six-transmembrane domain-containing protein [Ignavibacteriales bacterium]
MNLLDLARRFRKGIFIALSLVVIEHVAWIIEPALFGKVIDALIDRASTEGPALQSLNVTPLFLWIIVFAVNSGTGVVRRIVDERIYLRIYAELATGVATGSQRKQYTVSKTVALTQLSEQYISFLQYRMPEIIDQIVSITGAVIALAAFDWRLSVACLTIILPLMQVTGVYTRKVSTLQKQYHDNFETTTDVFARQSVEEVKSYYARLTSLKQSIANWGAFNFGIMRLALLVIFIAVLYISIDLDNFSTGAIYSIVAYIWTFITTSEYIPELLESWTSLKDISRRLKEGGE